MKKLLNDKRRAVREMLEGFTSLNPGVALADTGDIVVVAGLPAPPERRVAVISGGGAGHEPAHAGYVGSGMLRAAVSGDVFTSPSVDAVLAAIRLAAGPRGAVLVVKNYTGDRLNFGLAAELARGAGIPTEVVVVADDVSLRATVTADRRRGIAGTVLVHKAAGAAAEAGCDLATVAAAGRVAAQWVGTMGVALGPCTVPTAEAPSFVLADDEVELGLGIHGEPGVERAKLPPVDALVARMLSQIIEDRKLSAGDRVVLLVNNLGGTTTMELDIVARAAIALLRGRGLLIERAWAGTLLSALEMPGCSLSVMKVDDALLALLDAPTEAPAWPERGRIPARRAEVATAGTMQPDALAPRSVDVAGPLVRAAALACAAALVRAEPELTALDRAAGDGDLGQSMLRGAEAVQAFCAANDADDAASVLAGIGTVLRRAVAGSSGPFYAVGLLRAARSLAEGSRAESSPADQAACAWALRDASEAVAELGDARPGDRTMLDALAPAAAALASARGGWAAAWDAAALAAEAGARATETMEPRRGRASYLGQRAVGIRDGGAAAVAIWMRAIATPHD